ncbi:Non-specific lipid-transfer protein-like protein [Apostasia shenzhenica]|uniref:Non-specific lipid-transfer protein-like protein n=1 Tax=Apostasia shenzhenica TaxID=1088818 RepID=A0A2I0AVA5_9ASPA|nr:Non-specific lipid-transfer protein-like protein [Apostasia shenzhenica]
MAAVYALFFISALTARAMLAGAAAHPAKVECSAATTELMECLSFVSSGSKATKPSESCCTAVSTVAKKTPECLCAVAQEAPGLGFPLNLTRVRELPHECKVPMPDEGNCSGTHVRSLYSSFLFIYF